MSKLEKIELFKDGGKKIADQPEVIALLKKEGWKEAEKPKSDKKGDK